MDKVRRGLLEYLSYNCRLTTTQIAKLLKTQRYRVDYYKKKFIKDKVIIGHELLLNYEFLGFTEYFIYLRVFKYQQIKPKIVNFLESSKIVRWSGEATRLEPDLLARIIGRDAQEIRVAPGPGRMARAGFYR